MNGLLGAHPPSNNVAENFIKTKEVMLIYEAAESNIVRNIIKKKCPKKSQILFQKPLMKF